MIQVLKVLPGGKVLVDAGDRCRIVIQPENKTVCELASADDAGAYVSAFNSYNPGREHWAEVVGYAN